MKYNELTKECILLLAVVPPVYKAPEMGSLAQSKSQVKIGFSFFSEILLRTQISIFHSKKSDFFFSEPKFSVP